MRSLLKLALVSLAAFGLSIGAAYAQDKPEFKAGLTLRNAFGQTSISKEVKLSDESGGSEEDKDTSGGESGFRDDWQSDFLVTFASKDITARALLRFRDDSVNPNASRSDMYWKASDTISLGFMGRSLGGFPGTAVAYGTYGGTVTGGSGMPVGGYVGPVGFFSNANGIDIRYSGGGITAGLAVMDSCIPTCGYDLEGRVNSGAKADLGLVPYFQGAFGDLTLGVYLVSASAKIAEQEVDPEACANQTLDGTDCEKKDKDSKSATASLMDVNLVYKLGDIGIAFEYASQTQSCNAIDLTTTDGCSDLKRSDIALGVAAPAGSGTIRAHIVTISQAATLQEDVDYTSANTQLLVEYVMPMAAGFRLVPLFGTDNLVTEVKTKDVSTKTSTTSTTMVALGARGDF